MKNQAAKIGFFYRTGDQIALGWISKIKKHIKNKGYSAVFVNKKPDILIVLGGDGTILKAARKYHRIGSIILGLNLGKVGFLASVREEKNFLRSFEQLFTKQINTTERMMILVQVLRNKKVIFTAEALNEVVIKNPLGMVDLEARIAGHPVQYINGSGLLVSTATGSTAYNLSAHGPIVMPNIKCFIVTEILDHSIPSPSVVIKHTAVINIKVISYRERGILSILKTGKKIDVLAIADGETIFPLEEKDKIVIKKSPHLVKFAELEKNYFFKSLQEKFGFK